MTDDEEENAVRQLGDLIGYGRMMQLAEQVRRTNLTDLRSRPMTPTERAAMEKATQELDAEINAELAQRL